MKYIFVFLFVSFIFIDCERREYTVHPYSCPSFNTCLTLEDYVTIGSLYIKNHSKFAFLPGDHNLSITMIIDSVTNLTLEGLDATKTFLWATGKIKVINSSEIVIKQIMIRHGSYNVGVTSFLEAKYSSLYLQNVSLLNINFPNTFSRAASIINSNVTITQCSFNGGYSDVGGALKINSSKVYSYDNVTFLHNRGTVRGAAISCNNSELLFCGSVLFYNNTMHLDTSHHKELQGGAIYAFNCTVIFQYSSADLSNESVTFKQDYNTELDDDRVKFISNLASGGGAIYSEHSTFYFNGKADIIGNIASFGAAIVSIISNFYFTNKALFLNHRNLSSVTVSVVHSNITFQGNVLFANNSAQDNWGVLNVYNSRVVFYMNLTFMYNFAYIGGAVYLSKSELIVSGTFKCLYNEATFGGCVSFEQSQLILKPPVQLVFHNNKAAGVGGALFYQDITMHNQRCFPTYTYDKEHCFFLIKLKNITLWNSIHFSFYYNVATAGSDIFGGHLDQCTLYDYKNNNSQYGLDFIKQVSTFNHSEDDYSFISSHSFKICYCNKVGLPQCDKNEITYSMPHGRILNLSVVAVGQNNGPVPSEILHSFTSDSDAKLIKLTPDYFINSTSCHNISFQLLSTEGKETFTLYPSDCNSDNSALKVNVEFDFCPPGFKLFTYTCECETALKQITNHKVICDIQTGLIKHPGKIWIQPLKGKNFTYKEFMWTKRCPSYFCNSSNSVWLNFSSFSADNQCLEKRTSVACGSCAKNYSLALSSLDCRACKNHFIALTIVFLLAGIVVIIVLTALRITVAAATINGLILYANIVNISKDVFFPRESERIYIFFIFVAWLNLDFGVSTCYFTGLDMYTYTWLQFAFPFYLWALIITIIIISRYSAKLAKLFGSNPVAVLATVVLMSYTKLLHASNSALEFTFIKYSNGTEKMAWKLDPSILYFRGKHIPLALFSVCVIALLIVPYIIILLFGYHLQTFSHKKIFFWINKFKPFLDSYYAPYQKHTRFWTGFLLVVRTCLYITNTAVEDSEIHVILIAESFIFAVILLLPWFRIQVYEKAYLQKLEVSFIFNILILAMGTYYAKSLSFENTVLSLLSVGIAFTEFIGIILFHIIKHCQAKTLGKVWKVIHRPLLKKLSQNSILHHEVSNDIKNATVAEFTTTSIKIREPLLDNDISQL